MTKRKAGFGAGAIILVVAILIGINVISRNKQETAATAQPPTNAQQYALANDETTQRDQLTADKVNLVRLRARISARHDQPVDTTQLDSQINAIISQNPDITFGVSITDVNSGATYHYGNSAPMTAASVTKVLTATDYLKEVDLGHKSLDTIMVDGHTAQYDMEQMIVVSDNDAWHVLNDALGYPQMQSYAHSIGLSSYAYSNNVISAKDTALLLHDLYTRKLITEDHTQLLLSYMARANYRDLIIPAVPETDTVYHKAGEYAGSLNDAAIITNDSRAIVISIFTKSNKSYSKSRVASLMQDITTPALVTFQLN